MERELREAIIAEARELYQDNEIQIDDDATVNPCSEGSWVQAWVWVPEPEVDE